MNWIDAVHFGTLRARLAAACGLLLCLGVATVYSTPRGGGGDGDGGGDGTPPEDGGSLSGNPLFLSRPDEKTASYAWVGAVTNYKVTPVECNGVNIGRLDFKYRPYTDTGYNPDAAGAALEGGFTANGNDPCIFGQQPGTEYFWVQTIVTNRPLPGRGPGEYTDAENPRADPAYPYGSNNNNPANDAFTDRSYYDAPSRNEEAARDIHWLAENMLCCRVGNKINVIGSFLWGFDITADGAPDDGTVGLTGNPRHLWGPATQSAIDTVAKEAKGTKTEPGWTVDSGCCCNKLFIPFFCFSDTIGNCTIPIAATDPSMVIDRAVIFPRNRSVANFTLPPAPGWIAQPWSGGMMAPLLSWQSAPTQMFQQGIHLINLNPQPGPASYQMQVRLSGHESFIDVFLHNANDNHWFPWAAPTQEMLGDMNGDAVVDSADIPIWQLAFSNPPQYQVQYPGLNPIFRGDLSHNNVLDPPDLSMLQTNINTHLNFDAQNLDPKDVLCFADVAPAGGNSFVNVDDLLAVINGWGPCPLPCPPYCAADVTQNCFVNVDDLLAVINGWGPCP